MIPVGWIAGKGIESTVDCASSSHHTTELNVSIDTYANRATSPHARATGYSYGSLNTNNQISRGPSRLTRLFQGWATKRYARANGLIDESTPHQTQHPESRQAMPYSVAPVGSSYLGFL